jgi:clan AA aspartic protease (TIGR02281 family)
MPVGATLARTRWEPGEYQMDIKAGALALLRQTMRTIATALARPVFLLILLLPTGNISAETIGLEDNHGVYMVPVRINDTITLPFVIDSGASDVAIPSDVFRTLTRSGSIGPSDALGAGTYKLADGSTQESERFLLHEVRIGNKVIKDVVANVAPISGDPLLGQSFLSKLTLWTLDNSRHVLILADESIATNQITSRADEYKMFVQDGWLLSANKPLTESGQLIMRRYGLESNKGSLLNVLP